MNYDDMSAEEIRKSISEKSSSLLKRVEAAKGNANATAHAINNASGRDVKPTYASPKEFKPAPATESKP